MKDLNKIDTWDGLLALVIKGLTEGPHLDFKRDAYWDQRKPPDKRDRDKEELRRDATSFANNGGGILFIGVDEDSQQGRAVSVLGIEEAVKNEYKFTSSCGWILYVRLATSSGCPLLDDGSRPSCGAHARRAASVSRTRLHSGRSWRPRGGPAGEAGGDDAFPTLAQHPCAPPHRRAGPMGRGRTARSQAADPGPAGRGRAAPVPAKPGGARANQLPRARPTCHAGLGPGGVAAKPPPHPPGVPDGAAAPSLPPPGAVRV
ncbi:AlbA family DNA-binding domain-containing protein [Cystobacter fuscus]|uniref:AlbA family DNA-binding domain-containing protein n=1 Tax=Cystobacter fuscus TaxID=43 RepID=UPI0009715197